MSIPSNYDNIELVKGSGTSLRYGSPAPTSGFYTGLDRDRNSLRWFPAEDGPDGWVETQPDGFRLIYTISGSGSGSGSGTGSGSGLGSGSGSGGGSGSESGSGKGSGGEEFCCSCTRFIISHDAFPETLTATISIPKLGTRTLTLDKVLYNGCLSAGSVAYEGHFIIEPTNAGSDTPCYGGLSSFYDNGENLYIKVYCNGCNYSLSGGSYWGCEWSWGKLTAPGAPSVVNGGTVLSVSSCLPLVFNTKYMQIYCNYRLPAGVHWDCCSSIGYYNDDNTDLSTGSTTGTGDFCYYAADVWSTSIGDTVTLDISE